MFLYSKADLPFYCKVEFTKGQWDAELESGWPGSNGSSCSTDTICGVRIGSTTREYSVLPADHHDLGARIIRRLLYCNEISDYQAAELKKRNDIDHFNRLLAAIQVLDGARYAEARSRVSARYYALRWLGTDYHLPCPDKESYPDV